MVCKVCLLQGICSNVEELRCHVKPQLCTFQPCWAGCAYRTVKTGSASGSQLCRAAYRADPDRFTTSISCFVEAHHCCRLPGNANALSLGGATELSRAASAPLRDAQVRHNVAEIAWHTASGPLIGAPSPMSSTDFNHLRWFEQEQLSTQQTALQAPDIVSLPVRRLIAGHSCTVRLILCQQHCWGAAVLCAVCAAGGPAAWVALVNA